MPLADSEMEREEPITRQRSVGSVIGGAVGSMVKSISSSDAKGADAPKEEDDQDGKEKSPEEKKKAEEEAKVQHTNLTVLLFFAWFIHFFLFCSLGSESRRSVGQAKAGSQVAQRRLCRASARDRSARPQRPR
jgi:hypothetical protein